MVILTHHHDSVTATFSRLNGVMQRGAVGSLSMKVAVTPD
jgi:hypothetical protein